MLKQIHVGLAAAILAFGGSAVKAQPYSNAVMSLNPVAYWPLTETTPPPASGMYVATNLGSAGNGFYGTWWQTNGASSAPFNTNSIVHIAGAIAGDSDMAMANSGANGQFVIFPRFTNGVRNAALDIKPPFTVEVWVNAANNTQTARGVLGQGSWSSILEPSRNYAPLSEGFGIGQWGGNFFFVTFNGSGSGDTGKTETDVAVNPGQWEHLVFTFDGVNSRGFGNGVFKQGKAAPANSVGQTYVPNMIMPFIIGTQHGQNTFIGNLDEVAVYTNILSDADILNHYQTGTNAARSTSYSQVVLANNPTIYARLGEAAFAGVPDPSTYPVAKNYGSLGSAANGLYQPGTQPGGPGPSGTGFGASSHAVALDGFNSGVDIGNGNLPSLLNPTNNQPLTVAAWFKANPADCVDRFQVIAGHSDSSWRLGFGGGNSDTHFNPGNGPELQFANVADVVTNGFYCNDGNWHFMVGSSDGSTDSLYVDGRLAKTGTSVASIAGTVRDVILGGDPQWTTPSANADGGRYFDGSIAHVAFFTNALTSTQVRTIYDLAGVPPLISIQPTNAPSYNAGNIITITTPIINGSAPITYQWYSTNGTLVAGQTSSNLIFNPCTVGNNGSYYLVASNAGGATTSAVVTLLIYGPPTVTQSSLADIRVFVGTTPKLAMSALGAPPLTFFWKANNAVISGATNSTYTVSASSVGTTTYIGTVTNAFGSASVTNVVAVIAAPTAPYPMAVLTNHPVAFWRLDESAGTVAYDYAGGYNGNYTNVAPGCGQPTVQGYSSATEPLEMAPIFGNVSGGNNKVGYVPTYLNFGASAGSTTSFSIEAWFTDYFQQNEGCLVTLGYGNGGEQFNLDMGSTIGSQYYPRFFVRDAAGAAHVASGTAAANSFDGNWHHVVAVCDEVNGQVSLYFDGRLNASATIATNAGLLSSTMPITLGARMGSSSDVAFTNQFIGAMDNVAIYNYALSAAQVQAHYGASGIAPIVTQPPTNATANEGGSATFTVAAIGTAPLQYQWYGPSGLLPGKTSATLTLTSLSAGQAGSYYVVVHNSYNPDATSASASLTVNTGAPVMTGGLQPASQTVWQGDPVTYLTTVQGTMPFTYVWATNGVTVSGATGSSYSFTASSSVTVSVHISNSFGPLTPDPSASLTVNAATQLVPTNFNTSMKIVFKGYTNAETLTDFPALVRLSTNVPGFTYAPFASTNGADLRFTPSYSARVLNYEIERWNPAGESLVWVQVPTISGTNTSIMAYWGNSAAAVVQDYTTNGNTWKGAFSSTPEFQVVYHFNAGGFPVADSSTWHRSATTITAPLATTGIAGGGGAFDGNAHWTRVVSGTYDVSNNFTLSAWINLSAGATRESTIWANRQGGWNANGFGLYVGQYGVQDGSLNFDTGDGTLGSLQQSGAGFVSIGQWHQITASVDRTAHTASVYQDGTLAFTANLNPSFQTTNQVWFGANMSSDCYLYGAADEARIEAVTRSPGWVWASYATVAPAASFSTCTNLVSTYVADKTLHYSVVNGKLVLSWAQGTLQSCSTVNGTYTDMVGAPNPSTISPTGTAQFFRLKIQ